MAKKRTRETHEKRAREHAKRVKRAQKLADRVERNARKREARENGTDGVAAPPAAVGSSPDGPRPAVREPEVVPPLRP